VKYIEKGEEPEEFTRWKATQVPAPVWDSFSGSSGIKQRLHQALMAEQGYICCYCGTRISGQRDSHIEHFRPRYRYPGEAFKYSNLLASCEGGTNQAVKPGEQHCGHRKDQWYDCALTVSPLDPACERRFRYTLAGEIRPVEEPDRDRAAQTTIERLGLNSPHLLGARKAALSHLSRLLDQSRPLDREKLNRLIIGYGQKDARGRYTPFCVALLYVLNAFL
jgi:uncharacterized protein (TIGR02646 family)